MATNPSTPQPPDPSGQWQQLLDTATSLTRDGSQEQIGDVLIDAYTLGIVRGQERIGPSMRAEIAQLRAQLAQARGTIRAGDWPGLWRALDVDRERLPVMHVPLDTAPGFDAGESLELATAGLDTDQETRGSHIEIVKVGRWRYELSWHPDGGWIELAGPRVWGLRRAKRRAARHLRRLESECVTVARVTSLGIDPEGGDRR